MSSARLAPGSGAVKTLHLRRSVASVWIRGALWMCPGCLRWLRPTLGAPADDLAADTAEEGGEGGAPERRGGSSGAELGGSRLPNSHRGGLRLSSARPVGLLGMRPAHVWAHLYDGAAASSAV